MKIKTNFRYRNEFFSIVYIVYACLSVISWSQFVYVYPIFNKIYLVYQLLCIPCLVILYILTKPTSQSLLLYFILSIYSIYSGYKTGNTMFMLFVLFFFAAKNIDYIKLMKKDVLIKILLLSLIFILYELGYLNIIEPVYRASGEIRATLGFNYPTYPMYIITLIGVEWIMIRNRGISYLELILIGLIGYYYGDITDARGEKILLLFIVGGVFLLKLRKFKGLELSRSKFIRYVLILLPELVCGFSYLVINFLKDTTPWYWEINSLFSGRINIIQFYYRVYGLKWFPSKIVLNYVGGNGKWVQVIDNIYLYLGVELGIIALCIYLGIVSFLINNAIKRKNYILILVIIGFIILNLTEYVTLAPAIAIYCIMWKVPEKEKEVIKDNYGSINNSTYL